MADDSTPISDLPSLVPKAPFIDDVEKFVAGRTVDEAVTELRALLLRYRHVEAEVVQRAQKIALKEPEISRCLGAVEALQRASDAGEDTVLDFSLANHVFARARVREPKAVSLWLGANVMLQYPLGEARELLQQQLAGCRKMQKQLEFERAYCRDQVTTTEVGMARVFNHGVLARKKAAA